jgi:D-glycero-beta-D-manno-heptose-7-phosphate kinase
MTDLLAHFRRAPVLVAGDLMLDEFVWGGVTRISPEAPVPVVEVQSRTFTLGGAANAAANVAALGGTPTVLGLLGEDAAGDRVVELLGESSAAVRDATRPTTTKTRILAGSQQVVRIDTERPGDSDARTEELLFARAASMISNISTCIISDYGKGVISASFAPRLIELCRQNRVPVIVDPKGTDYRKYRGATLVKPNQLEAGKVLNRELRDPAAVRQAGRDLLEFFGGDTAVLITQGAQGMTLFERHRAPTHVPALAREVFDVTGAGDTVAGVLALALAAGGTLDTGCRLAAAAAAVVVGKKGTATLSLDELRTAALSRAAA